jgi:hypothetical protein
VADRRLCLAIAALAILCAASLAILLFVPAVFQDPNYHNFAARQTLLGIPNFWNVVSNAGFLAAAAFGVRGLRSRSAFTEPWERHAFGVLLAGTAMVAFGSAYYHLHPDSTTLFWDRLPMTLVFMSLFAATIGERINLRIGRRCLLPFLALGVVSPAYSLPSPSTGSPNSSNYSIGNSRPSCLPAATLGNTWPRPRRCCVMS